MLTLSMEDLLLLAMMEMRSSTMTWMLLMIQKREDGITIKQDFIVKIMLMTRKYSFIDKLFTIKA